MAEQPTTKTKEPAANGKVVTHKANGQFAKGNKLGRVSGKATKFRRAQELMEEMGFDPLTARITYHQELMDEANTIRDNLHGGIFVDLAGNEHVILTKALDAEGKPIVEVKDAKRLTWAHDKHAALRREADAIAASLTNYVYPQLKAIEVDNTSEGTWTAIVARLSEAITEPEGADS
jgi:hypothetical protein